MNKPTYYLCLAVIACLAALRLPSQEITSAKVDSSSIFITDAARSAFVIQTYNRILIGTWFELKNDEVKSGMSITVQDYPIFAPEKVRVTVKAEPTVVAKEDGTWVITFKEVKP